MVSSSQAFLSKPWDASFKDEVLDYWVETIEPAVSEVEAAIRDNSSILRLAAGLAGTAKEAWPGLAILGAGVAGHAPTVTLAGGSVAAASAVLKDAWSRHAELRAIKAHPFYFLYGLSRLGNVG
jgi:hypothetical protein